MLRKGQRFTMNTVRWRVAYVNFSRAHCVADVAKVVAVHDRRTGQDRTFTATAERTLDISPDSPVELLKELR